MSGERDLTVRLMLEDREALTRLHTALGQIENESKRSTASMNLSWAGLASQYYLAKEALQPVIGFMREAVNAAAEQEDAVNRLNMSLRNQGIYSTALSQSLQTLASNFQSTTRFSDEAIMKIEQRLISLGGIAPDKIGRVTKAILDFSTATGKDVEASTMAFVQAANGKATALGKFGLVIDQTVPKSQKLDEALRLVEQRFGGAAAGDINTYSGAVANLKNSWSDFLETIGDIIVKNPEVIKNIQQTKEILEGLTKVLKDNRPLVDEFFGALLTGGESFITKMTDNKFDMGAMLSGMMDFATGNAGSGTTSLIQSMVGDDAAMQDAAAKMQEFSDSAIQQKLSLEEQLSAIHQQFNQQDFQKDLINNERKIEAQRQQILAWYDEQASAQMARQQQDNEMLTFALDTQKKAHESLWSVAGKARDTFSSGMSAMFVNLMKGTGSVKEAFTELGWSMVKILTDYLVQLAVNMAIAKAMQAAHLAATIPVATATASAWAPAAALVSLATFGTNAVAAAAGITSTVALAQGLALLSAVPGLAEGGTVTSGGTVLVGERGPELLSLPRAATVTPLGQGGTSIQVTFHIYNPTGKIDEELMSQMETRFSSFLANELERL